ncbi:MAG: ABC transporter ATP-binding protein [Phycisphaerales bacterium]|jgi:ABC-type multidrug transport system fused ATPase/permease subunit|nr:ABC transporter ATP-binding protein [Phycisphaerales bacterium]
MSDDRPFTVYRRLMAMIWPYRGRVALIILLTLVASSATLLIPWSARQLFADAVRKADLRRIYLLLGAMLGLMAVVSFAWYLAESQLAHISLRLVETLRRQVADKLLKLPIAHFARTSSGDALGRCFHDINRLRTFLNHAFLSLGGDLILAAGSIGFLFYLSTRLTLVLLAVTPIGVLTLLITSRRVRRGYHAAQNQMADLTGVLSEQLGAMPAIRAFGGEEHEQKRFSAQSEQLFDQTLRTDRQQAAARSTISFLAAVGVVLVLGYGARLVLDGPSAKMRIEDLIAFALYTAFLADPIRRLSRTHYEIQQSLACGRRVLELLDWPQQQDTGTRTLPDHPPGRLSFESIRFAYRENEPVLHDFDLTIEPGQTLAVVGPSGAGKSTLSMLPMRFYEPSAGRILLDGIDLRELKLADLRRHIGWVGQDPFIFSGTVYENISYGSWNATKESIENAARQACADSFIQSLPHGFNTRIGERGVDLSGGQRVRLAIARVILRSPALVIFDESTSALDTETETRLWAEISQWLRGRTTLIIAHRLATILDCPRIVVLDKGRLVGDGTAEQLRHDCPTFNRIFQQQMNLIPQ